MSVAAPVVCLAPSRAHTRGVPTSRAGTAALWVAFVVIAMVSGWIAVTMVGNAVTPASIPVLTSGEVSTRLSTASPAATPGPEEPGSTEPKSSNEPTNEPSDKGKPQTTAKPSSSPTGSTSPQPQATESTGPALKTVVRTVASRGGSAVAACTSGLVTLRSWSPAVGYRVDEVRRGPSSEVEIKFVSSANEVTLRVRCNVGVPTGSSEVEDGSGDDD